MAWLIKRRMIRARRHRKKKKKKKNYGNVGRINFLRDSCDNTTYSSDSTVKPEASEVGLRYRIHLPAGWER